MMFTNSRSLGGVASIAALSASAIACSLHAQTAVQWRVADGGNGHWYAAKRWDAPSTWEQSMARAELEGGHLACLTSAAENQFISDSSNLYQSGCALSQEGWHLGGYQDLNASDYSEPAGGWRWISDEPWQYTAWLTDVPGGDRPNNYGNGGEQYLKMSEMPWAPRWDDIGVGSEQTLMCGAIVEWSADCNADGIVDYGQCRDGSLLDANANNVPDCCEAGDPCAVNLLVNGGFEVGPQQSDCSWLIVTSAMTHLAPWAVVAADVDRNRMTQVCTNESWQSIEGEFSTDLDGWNTGGAIQQSISTVAGHRYLLTFELTGNCGGNAIRRMRATAGSTSADFSHTCQPVGFQTWSPCQMSFTATGITTAITLASLTPSGQGSGANGAVVDDVRVSHVDPPCPGDISGNGGVDGVDLTVLLGLWGTDGTGGEFFADVTNDGLVNGADLAVVLTSWGPCAP